ncbi:MAG: hypothetical protein EZS28_050557, partial [Streblomastix strix]
TFRPLFNPKIYPTSWLSSQIALRNEEVRNKPLGLRPKNNKVSSYEIPFQSYIYNHGSIWSIDGKFGHINTYIFNNLKITIQGVTIQEINKRSSLKDGPSTVAVHYDMILNDTIRVTLINFE